MSDDLLFLEDGSVKVSEMALQIPEFKDFKRYDTSTNKVFFQKAMSYIFYVYQVFGEEKSYLHNLSLSQRKVNAVKRHTGSYKDVSDFEENPHVKKCIEAYMLYSRTRSEILFDTLKEDIDKYIDFIQTIPHTIEKSVKVPVKVLNEDNVIEERWADVKVDIPNTTQRVEALKQAKDLNDLYKKTLADVAKDAKMKKTNSRMFEDPSSVSKMVIPEDEFPMASE